MTATATVLATAGALTASTLNTNRSSVPQPTPIVPQDPVHTRPDDVAKIGERLSKLVQFKTVSWDNGKTSSIHKCAHEHDQTEKLSQFDKDHDNDKAQIESSRIATLELLDYLEETYPLIHSRLHVERINTQSLLITWRGSDDSETFNSADWRDPAHGATLFMAHSDVVPAEMKSETKWKHPPFSGHIDEEGFVWGRGTVDNKGNLLILLEATERLIASGFCPKRTIYIASGHDEEIGGHAGSKQIVSRLQARGVKSLAMVVDEGTMCVQSIVRGLDPYRVALIGVAEKGSMSLKMTAHRKANGAGHASTPSPDDPVVVLSKAISAIEARERQLNLDAGIGWMSRFLAPYMPPLQRFVMSNLWLFGKTVGRELQKKPQCVSETCVVCHR